MDSSSYGAHIYHTNKGNWSIHMQAIVIYYMILLSMKKAPFSSLSLACRPERRLVKKLSPPDSNVVVDVTNTS